jgi:superfamily II DNA or RNA helicase
LVEISALVECAVGVLGTHIPGMPALRKYQSEDVDKLRDTLRSGARRVLFEASVGYGKSVVIEHLAAAYSSAGRRVWVLSNRSAVVNQLRARAGDMPGVTVMTVQAADRRRDKLAADPAHLVLVDEVHMGGAAAQYRRVLDCAPGAVAVGFTGTPRPETFSVFPAHVQGRGAAWLTEQGFLAPLKYAVPNELDLRHVKKRRGEFDEAQIAEIMAERRIYSNAIENFRVYGLHVPTLGFCVNITHATETAEQFRRAGHSCEVLTGKDKADEVEYKIDCLKDGGLVFSIDKVSAGFDLPDLRTLLSLRPTASPQLWVQQLGRAARASEGKEFGRVVDHCGNGRRLGSLTMLRNWRDPEDDRQKRQTEDGQSLGVRTCGECLAMFDAGPARCPECGTSLAKETRIPTAEAVRLREIEAAEMDAKAEADKALKKRQGQSIRQMAAYLGWNTAVSNMRKRHDRAARDGDEVVLAFAATELRRAGVSV